MKRATSTLALVWALSMGVAAQNVERPDSYNYTRGVEAIQKGDAQEALEYLDKELKENPDNGYACVWVATVKLHDKEYGTALSMANKAVKKIPAKDNVYRSWAHNVRADVYLCLEDTVNALKDFGAAIALQPEGEDCYEKRAQVLYEQGKYDEANKDYDKLIALNEGGVMGYMGKGRNLNAQKRYEEAIALFNHVVKLHKGYSSGYAFRADSHIGLKQWEKAIDNVITALAIDKDNKAFYLLQQLADSALTETVAKLKVQTTKEPNEDYWDYCLGVVYETREAYAKAIERYQGSMKKAASDVTAHRIANCYNEMGDYHHALEYVDMAIEMDSSRIIYPMLKAGILDYKGEAQKAIAVLDGVLTQWPDYDFAYYRRGWIKEHSGDVDGALEDYTLAVSMDYAYAYLNRGRVYKQKGEDAKAAADFKRCIELEQDTETGSKCSFYAYFYLGENEKALQILNESLKEEDKNSCYEATCLHSLMGHTEQALEYLKKAFEHGYCDFNHIRRDHDLDHIRQTEAFEQLLLEYEEKKRQKIEAATAGESATYEEKTVEVPFTKEGGVCRVKCEINGLPLHFIFDTGASAVSISTVEATFMLKNGYLKDLDFGGSQHYTTASGELVEGTAVALRQITFGGLVLDNVKATIVKAQSAPLLLGQSVLGRLGKIEIDNEKRVLRITQRQKK